MRSKQRSKAKKRSKAAKKHQRSSKEAKKQRSKEQSNKTKQSKNKITTCAYIVFKEVQATIARNEGRDLLAILDQLNSDALSNGRVRLLSFNTAAIGSVQEHMTIRYHEEIR